MNKTTKKLAAELVERHDLFANFPTFTKDSYKNPTKFASANEIRRPSDVHAFQGGSTCRGLGLHGQEFQQSEEEFH